MYSTDNPYAQNQVKNKVDDGIRMSEVVSM